MKWRILHESDKRIRVRAVGPAMTLDQADILERYLDETDGVRSVQVFDRTGDAVIRYRDGCRESIIDALAVFSYEENTALVPEHSSRAITREYEDKIFFQVTSHLLTRLFVPAPIRYALAVVRSVRYIAKAVDSIRRGRMEVSILDATAIVVSMIRGDFATASSVMFLLHLGDTLEEWTHKKSAADLAGTMALNVDKVWLRTAGGEDVLVPVRDVEEGDLVLALAGNMIALDGVVESGEAMVNQSSMTGESEPVRKTADSIVYAGTVVDEGEIVIRVTHASGSGRYDRIISMIEDSERLKSGTEDRAYHLADRLVPWSFAGTGLVLLLTQNVTRAVSVLMVDFSCALKLAMTLSVLSAMKEAGRAHITVKGGKFLEAAAEAKTIVFDKTGTLTRAEPRVAAVIPFGAADADEALRLAACLEEHFPHSMAKAVVKAALEKDLSHKEKHTKVEYIVAHGIASTIDGKKVVIGSYHFVFEDEGCSVPEGEEERFRAVSDEYSHLYLALDGTLAAVICIEDPLRAESAYVVGQLKDLGFERVVMMTGDSERTARAVAEKLGLDDYYSEVLPEDKAEFIRREHEAGRKVIMIGDGVNDSPALSEADAGIAISDGAAIAREVADIMITADDLTKLITLRKISLALMERIDRNYRLIVGINSTLMVLGALGILAPSVTALFHNASTIAISMNSMTGLLEDDGT